MLILFFVFINFSHLRTRANTRALSLTHTHTHARTHTQNFSAREANAATWAAAVWLDGPYNISTFTCPVQSIATTLSLAKQRLYKVSLSSSCTPSAADSQAFKRHRLWALWQRTAWTYFPAKIKLSYLQGQILCLLKFALKSRKFDSIPYLSARWISYPHPLPRK